jgi:two-component system, NarL family, response regulator LiaR
MDVARAGPTRPLSSSAVTVGIVDGDPLARQALRARLATEPDLEVVGEALDASTAVELVRYRRPNLLLLALELHDRSGSPLVAELLTISAQTRIIVLAVDANEDAQLDAVRIGAAGCLLKSIDLDVLPRVLRGVRAGEAAVTRALGTRIVQQLNALGPAELNRLRPIRSSLTQREWEVLDLLVERGTTGEIAGQLGVSRATVRTHVRHILRKLGLHSRQEAIRYVERLRHVSGG